jgi:hypothetical protein
MAENVRIGLWISSETLARLKKSPHGVSEEIRRRLEESYKRDSVDQRTRELEDAITALAGLVEYDTGVAWHAHPEPHAVFVEAVSKLLAYATSPIDMPQGAESKALEERFQFGVHLTKSTDTLAERGGQLFRIYLLMKQPAPGDAMPRPPAIKPKKGRRR